MRGGGGEGEWIHRPVDCADNTEDVDQSSITFVAGSAADTHDVSEVRPSVARRLSRFARRLARFHE